MTLKEFIEMEEEDIKEEELNEGLKIFRFSSRLERAISRVEKKEPPKDVDAGVYRRCINELKKFHKEAMVIENKYADNIISKSEAKSKIRKLISKAKMLSRDAKSKLGVKVLKNTGLHLAIGLAVVIAIGLAVYFGVSTGGFNVEVLGKDVSKYISMIRDNSANIIEKGTGAAGAVGAKAKDAMDTAKRSNLGKTASSAASGAISKATSAFSSLMNKGARSWTQLLEKGMESNLWGKKDSSQGE